MSTQLLKYITFSLSLLICVNSLSQNKDDINDKILNNYKVAVSLLNDHPDSSIQILSQNLAYDIADSSLRKKHINIRGIAYYYSAQYKEALNDLFQVLAYAKRVNDSSEQISARSNISLVLGDMGNNSQALKYLIECERLIEDELQYPYIYTNLGYIYENLEEHKIALEYHSKSFYIDSVVGDSVGLALDYINIGVQYLKLGNYAEAEKNLIKGRDFSQKFKDQRSLCLSFLNLGSLELEKKNFDLAIEYLNQCLEIARATENFRLVVKAQTDKADALGHGLNEVEAAIRVAKNGLQIAKWHNIASEGLDLNYILFKLHKQYGDSEAAIEYLEKFNQVKDSLDKINRSREFIAYELEYRFEKEVLKDSLEHAQILNLKDIEIKKQEETVSQKNKQLFAGIIGLVLFSVLSLLLFRRYRITKKQKKVISTQKENLELKSKEISDSISYAERIQQTILPHLDELPNFIKDRFVFFKPKDIVSGDFYWIEGKGNKLFMAVADCTGHGVPGAMVSVVCSRALTRSVKEENITDVDKILNRSREIIINQFLSNSGSVKDGMDICLISIEKKDTHFNIEYAGAYNPLMVISGKDNSSDINEFERLTDDEISLYEIPPNKQPVGFSFDPHPFSKKTFKLPPSSRLYLCTDGYQDQFGGANGKKFRRSQIRNILLKENKLTLEKQKAFLIDRLEEWMINEEQVDDICLMAIELQ